MPSENLKIQTPRRFRLRIEHALLISFLVHGLILSMKFALPDMGMPGSLLSKTERSEPVALSVKLAASPPDVPSTLAKPAPSPNSQKVLTVQAPAVAAGFAAAALVMPVPRIPAPAPAPESAPAPVKRVVRRRKPEALRKPVPVPLAPTVTESKNLPVASSRPSVETSVLTTNTPAPEVELVMPPVPAASAPTLQDLRRVEELRQEALRQEAARVEAAARREAAQREAQLQEALQHEARRLEASAQAAARQEAAQREAQRQETLQQELLRQEARRAEAAAQATARQEAAQREAQRQEALRQDGLRAAAAAQATATQEAAQREAQRQEALRQDGLRAAAAAQAAARQEAAQREAQRQEALRQEGLRAEAAAQAAARQEAAQREAQRQEAQRKAAAALAARLPEKQVQAPMESAKGRTMIGRTEQDLRLRMMAEGWRQKVEQNAPFDVLQAAKNSGPYENPVVTVSLRRDGSLESVVFERSSGVVAIDNAVRRIILMLSPFAPFTSDVAMEYDVVEIRRVWTFDKALRLLYGGR